MVFLKQNIQQKKQVNEYKMTETEIYKKLTNLSEKDLDTKNKKKLMPEIMSWLLVLIVAWVKKQEV